MSVASRETACPAAPCKVFPPDLYRLDQRFEPNARPRRGPVACAMRVTYEPDATNRGWRFVDRALYAAATHGPTRCHSTKLENS